MWERVRVPRAALVLAVIFVAVPTLLWLHLVWSTRPYSAAEIAADRARVEQTQEYDDTLRLCDDLMRSTTCPDVAWRLRSALEREPLEARTEPGDTATAAVLTMAATALAAGIVLGRPRDLRALLRRTAVAFGVGLWAAALVGVLWWWGTARVVEHRGTDPEPGSLPHHVIGQGALLVGGAAVAGVALGALLRRPVRAVAVGAATAVLTGVGLLATTPPLDPLLPALNVTAWLHGDQEYVGTEADEHCTEEHPALWPISGANDVRDGSYSELVCSRSVEHTSAEAAAYLSGVLGALLLAAAAAVWPDSGRHRPRRRVTG